MHTRPLLLLVALAACARVTAPPASPAAAPVFPPIPLATGPVALRIQYPSANALVSARDSSFLFGTLGTGEATLTVNGQPVEVKPNGAFIAWVPMPTEPRYELVAVRGADTTRVTHPIRLPAPRPLLADTGRLVVDSASVAPRGALALRPTDRVRVSVRAPANATVRVVQDHAMSLPLLNAGRGAGARLSAADSMDAGPSLYRRDSVLWAREIPAGELTENPRIVVSRGADTVTLPIAMPLAPTRVAVTQPNWVVLGADSAAASDTDRVVIARPVGGGTYKWFLFPGTIVEATGRVGDAVRVRLDERLEVWVDDEQARRPAGGMPGPRRIASNVRVSPSAEWVDVVIPVGERPPFQVEELGNTIAVTLYGTVANTDIVTYGANDSLVRQVTWTQETSDRARYLLHLAEAPYGYLALWRNGAFVLRVRRTPVVDAARPLAGIVVAVDPGHPPAGATGPTGLYEGVATLAVGERLRRILEERGARVVMMRETADPVALGDRPIMARRANAHVLVSVHLNALPDGINPFTAQGTGTYFFHPQAEPLARAVQNGMVRRMGLPNLGVYYDNLALARPTWMPAILCEGAFIMMPEQEALLRTPEFQEAYARGIADGVEAYFRGLATR